MGKKRVERDCLFTINVAGQEKQIYDYFGLMSWLAEDPQRIAMVAPDFAAKSTGLKTVLRDQALRPPAPAPAPQPEPEVAAEPEVSPEAESEVEVEAKEEEKPKPKPKKEPKAPADPDSLAGFNDIFDSVLDELLPSDTPAVSPKRKSRSAPKAPKAPRVNREVSPGAVAREQAGAKAEAGVKKIQEGAKKMNKLFGDLLKASTPKSNINSMLGVGWDDAVYQQAKETLAESFKDFVAGGQDLAEAVKLFIQSMIDDGATREVIAAFKPYIARYLQEAKQEQEKKKTPEGVVSAKTVQELLDAKVAAYLETGDHNGDLGIYLVYNQPTGGVKRVFLDVVGRDFGEALTRMKKVATDINRGVQGRITDAVRELPALKGKTIGYSTTKRTVSSFNENSDLGDRRLDIGSKHPNVLLKDLFSVDPKYAMWAANSLREGDWALTVRDYLRARPEYLEESASEMAARRQFEKEVSRIVKSPAIKKALKDLKLKVELGTNQLTVLGKTYENRSLLNEIGAEWDNESRAWVVSAGKVRQFLDALAERGGADRGGGDAPDTTEGTGIRDPRILEIRRRHDAIPDQSALGVPVGDLVDQGTQDLLLKGRQFGIPQDIIEEQIEDAAKISKAWQDKRGLFILASDPGSGKTYVLGAAMRELRRQGAKKFLYVTMNLDLIDQIKKDLKEYGVNDVQFVTYAGMRTRAMQKPYETDVIIFDEAHNIKKIEEAAVAKIAQDWIAKTKMTILSSATPYENPTQLAYLSPTGIFDSFGGFINFAAAYGAKITGAKATPDKPNPKQKAYWKRDQFSDNNTAAAQAYLRKLGIFTQRQIRLPMELVDTRLAPVTASSELVDIYQTLAGIIADKKVSVHGIGQAWVKNYLKRILEAAKVEQAIEEAKKAMNAGRFPIIFSETKSEREIDVDFWLEQEEIYAEMLASKKPGDTIPPRSDFDLPPQKEITKLFELASHELGKTIFRIEPIKAVIEAELGADEIALYNGDISGEIARKNLKDWTMGIKRLFLATMAKGGTGLSLHDRVGDHPTTMIVINLPWTATQVKQVAQRNARYGLASRAEIVWLFAEDIDLDRELAKRVGGRMADMSNLVTGEGSDTAARLMEWDLDSPDLADVMAQIRNRNGVLVAQDGREITLSDFEATNMVSAMLAATTQAQESGSGMLDDNTVAVGIFRNVLMDAHNLTPESADQLIMSFAGYFDDAQRNRGESLVLVPYGQSDAQLTPAQIRASLVDDRGVRFAGIRLRQGGAPEVQGSEAPVDADQLTVGARADIALAQGGVYKAHYEIREASDLIPSHNPSNFAPNPKYTLVNDRDYAGNKSNMAQSIAQEQNHQPQRLVNNAATSVEGPPMILPSGMVLGGNGRTIVLTRVYNNNPEAAEAYKALLGERASSFGIKPEELENFKRPVLVRVIDDLGADTAQMAVSRLNEDPQKALSQTEEAVARGRNLPPEVAEFIGDKMNRTGLSLAELLTDSGLEIFDLFVSKGVIPELERPKWIDAKTRTFTDSAKLQIRNMLIGGLFRSSAQMDSASPGLIKRLERIAPQVLRLSGSDWDVRDFFPGAIDAIAEQGRKKGSFSDLARAMVINPATGEMAPPYSLAEVAIAKAISDGNPTQAAKRFQEYADLAAVDISGQPSFFMQGMGRLDAFETSFPSPTGERVPEIVKGAQERLQALWRGDSLGMSVFGLDSIARLIDLGIVVSYKLYKIGTKGIALQRRVARFLGMQMPYWVGEQAAARRELMRDLADEQGRERYRRWYEELPEEEKKEADAIEAGEPVPMSKKRKLQIGIALAALGTTSAILDLANASTSAVKDHIAQNIHEYLILGFGAYAARLAWTMSRAEKAADREVEQQLENEEADFYSERAINSDRLIAAAIQSHLLAGVPIVSFLNNYYTEGGDYHSIRSRRVKDQIRKLYKDGTLDLDDLRTLGIDKYGEELYVPEQVQEATEQADPEKPFTYPDMQYIEARKTVGGKWRIAHKMTGDNLIPGESFPSAKEARKAYAKILEEFKQDQARGESVPAIVRAERIIQDFHDNGTALPKTVPVSLEKFRKRAAALFGRGTISRTSYSAVLRYLANKPEVESRAEGGLKKSDAPPAAQRAADRAINTILKGTGPGLTENTRDTVLNEIAWRLENAEQALDLTEDEISKVRKALEVRENRIISSRFKLTSLDGLKNKLDKEREKLTAAEGQARQIRARLAALKENRILKPRIKAATERELQAQLASQMGVIKSIKRDASMIERAIENYEDLKRGELLEPEERAFTKLKLTDQQRGEPKRGKLVPTDSRVSTKEEIRDRKLFWDTLYGRDNRAAASAEDLAAIQKAVDFLGPKLGVEKDLAKQVKGMTITPKQIAMLRAKLATATLTTEEREQFERGIEEFEKQLTPEQLEEAKELADKMLTGKFPINEAAQLEEIEIRQTRDQLIRKALAGKAMPKEGTIGARIVVEAAARLNKVTSYKGATLGFGQIIDQLTVDGVTLYQRGLDRAAWVAQMLAKFGEKAGPIISKAWEAIRMAARKILWATTEPLRKLAAAYERAGTPERRYNILKLIDKEVQQEAVEQAESNLEFSVDTLQELTGLSEEKATTVVELYKAMGIDVRQVKIAKGGQSDAKAMVEFSKDGTALITAYENADFSSMVHEGFHIYRRWLLNTENGHGINELKLFERWAGVKDGNWTREAEEKAAIAFERYIRNGIAPNEKFNDLFTRMGQWMREIYRVLTKSPIAAKVPKSAQTIFDQIFTLPFGETRQIVDKDGLAQLNQLSDDRLLKMLEARLSKATTPERRAVIQAQVEAERKRIGAKPPSTPPSGPPPPSGRKAKLNLSDYDNMTVGDLVDKLAQERGGVALGTIKDAPPEQKISVFEQNLLDLAGLPRAFMASADLSAPFRQGSILTLPPSQWGRAARAFREMIGSLRSEETFSNFRIDLSSEKLFNTARAAGLYIASQEIGENVITGGEETFISQLAKKAPIFGPLVKASERAYITYLDSLRMSTFNRYVRQIEKQGGTQAERRAAVVAAARWINIATGRGTFEGKLAPLERAMPLLSATFFAPRYVQSRLQLISPATYFKQPAVVRRQAFNDLMGYAATITAITALAALGGADVEWNPEDEDFLKLRFGNLRYDFLAGTQQVVRLSYLVGKAWGQAFIDSMEEAITGTPAKKRPGARTGLDILARFSRSKLAPIPSFLVDMQSGKDFIGRPFEVKQAGLDRMVPMFWRESVEAYLRSGWSGAAQQIPSAFGVGVSDYEKVSGIFSLKETPLTAELTRKGIEIGRLKPKEGESKQAFKTRATRTQEQLETYGVQLVTSDRYRNMSEQDKERAIRILRQRIGRGEPDRMLSPQLVILAAMLAGIKQRTNPQAADE